MENLAGITMSLHLTIPDIKKERQKQSYDMDLNSKSATYLL